MKNELYTYYLVYIRKGIDDTTISQLNNIPGAIYGYTANKKDFDLFKSQRSEKVFVYKKVSINSHEIKKLWDINNTGLIEIYNTESKYSDHVIPIAMTGREKLVTITDCTRTLYGAIWSEPNFQNPFMLKTKYIEALKTIGYVYGFGIFSDQEDVANKSTRFCNNLKQDTLQSFIDSFNTTLKGGESFA